MCIRDSLIPHPGFRVDRLADRTEQLQRAQVVLGGLLRTPLHERADGRGSGVELGGPGPVSYTNLKLPTSGLV